MAPPKKDMKSLLLSFDLEIFPFEKGRMSEKKKYRLSANGFSVMLKTLKKLGVRATFFTTLKFAEMAKREINRVLDRHELALHGYGHENYSAMPKNLAYERLKMAKEGLEDIFGVKLIGFRAPKLKPPDYKVLERLGIKYDSSSCQSFFPVYFNRNFMKKGPYNIGKIKILPITTVPFLGLPLNWFLFRNFGIAYAMFCTKSSLIRNDFINVYFHPWEFSDLGETKLPTLLKRNSGLALGNLLEVYINRCKSFSESKTMGEYLRV
jgi:peptidoglycan/xylan/chitin deacetylase (PgdA/CDA1 family)